MSQVSENMMDMNTPMPLDIHVDTFAKILKSLQPHLPISDAYERDMPQLKGSWWTSQQEHMVRWFDNQNSLGSGKFTRKTPNTSSRTTYRYLRCPAAFIWMAEALGEDPATVQIAADAARAEENAAKRSGIIRRHIPWTRIAELAQQSR